MYWREVVAKVMSRKAVKESSFVHILSRVSFKVDAR